MVGDGRKQKVEPIDVAERIAPQSAPGCRWRRGRRGDSGSRGVDWQKQREGLVHQLQQATGQMAVIKQAGRARRQESEELTNHMQIGGPTAGRMVTQPEKLANQQRSANKQ